MKKMAKNDLAKRADVKSDAELLYVEVECRITMLLLVEQARFLK